MKVMKIISSVFVLFVMVASCATTPTTLPEKYNLDNELEAVEQIVTIKAPSLEKIDNQSVIIKAKWNDYYLLVLRRPIDTRYSNPNIGLARAASTVTSGVDRVLRIRLMVQRGML